MGIIEEVSSYLQTRVRIKRMRKFFNDEIGKAKYAKAVEFPSQTEVILMSAVVSETGCVDMGPYSEIIRKQFEDAPNLYTVHIDNMRTRHGN